MAKKGMKRTQRTPQPSPMESQTGVGLEGTLTVIQHQCQEAWQHPEKQKQTMPEMSQRTLGTHYWHWEYITGTGIPLFTFSGCVLWVASQWVKQTLKGNYFS